MQVMRRCEAQLREAPPSADLLCHDEQVIRDGVLCAGLYPQVAIGAEVDGRAEWTVGSGKVAVHPSSVNHGLPNLVKLAPFLLFHEKLLTTQVFIRECSAVSPAVRSGAGSYDCLSEMHCRAFCCSAALWRYSTRKARLRWTDALNCASTRRLRCS